MPIERGGSAPVDATEIVRLLDGAGISRAAVLSLAYQPGNPNRPAVDDEYTRVRLENDWTSQQVAQFPARLVGFCGINPLKEYALTEIRRCARDPYLRRGLKLHFGNSDVQLDDPAHVARLREIFGEANSHRMAIVLHLRGSVTRRRPHGAVQARVFLNEVLPAAPAVPVQIAHLTGAGSYDTSIDEALSVFVDAIRARDPRMNNVYFEISGVTGLGDWKPQVARIAGRIRELGVRRVLFGSDAAPGDTPQQAWATFRELPLEDSEFAVIARNVAPYMRD